MRGFHLNGVRQETGTTSRGAYRRCIKRLVDLCAAAFLLVLTAPLLAVLALLIRVTQGRPVLFVQPRPGRDERIFMLYKFRTMRAGPGSDADRITPLGSFLRRWSLDELPQLFNVLRGDMSFIGPRPLLVEYLPRYTVRHRKRHAVRPGISGLAQVSGRNTLSWEEKFDLDIRYVDEVSLHMDLGIALRTLATIFRRRGVTAAGHASMPMFEGSAGREEMTSMR